MECAIIGHSVRTYVNVEAERFGDAITIAHLARYTFNGCTGPGLTNYRAVSMLRTNWRDELESIISQDRVSINVLFRDGSELIVLTPGEYGKPVQAHWRRDGDYANPQPLEPMAKRMSWYDRGFAEGAKGICDAPYQPGDAHLASLRAKGRTIRSDGSI